MSEQAVPFVVSALFVIASALCSYALRRRTEEMIRAKDGEYTNLEPPPHHSPESIGSVAAWAADAGPSAVSAISPAVAGLLLIDDPSDWVIALYILAAVGGLAAFVWTLFADPVSYTKKSFVGLTMLGGIQLVMSIALAIVAGTVA